MTEIVLKTNIVGQARWVDAESHKYVYRWEQVSDTEFELKQVTKELQPIEEEPVLLATIKYNPKSGNWDGDVVLDPPFTNNGPYQNGSVGRNLNKVLKEVERITNKRLSDYCYRDAMGGDTEVATFQVFKNALTSPLAAVLIT